MGNKKSDIPKELLVKMIDKCRGNVAKMRREMSKVGYHHDYRTIRNYIEYHNLESHLTDARCENAEYMMSFVEDHIDKLEAGLEPELKTITYYVSQFGHLVGYEPDRVKHEHRKREIESQKNADKEVLKEQMRNEMTNYRED